MSEPRLPWSRWFWKNHMGDAALRSVSPAARGVWWDLLGTIETCGEGGSITLSLEQLARIVGWTLEGTRGAVEELRLARVGDIAWLNGEQLRATCRRLQREARQRAAQCERQRRHRGSPPGGVPPGGVSPSAGGGVTVCHAATGARKPSCNKVLAIGLPRRHASVTRMSRGEDRGQRREEDSYGPFQLGELLRARALGEGASLSLDPDRGRPTSAWRPASDPEAAPAPFAVLLGEVLAAARSPAAPPPRPRCAPPDPRPNAIRDPVALARYAQRRGQVKPGYHGLLRALWAAAHALREAARPAAMFWYLLRVDPRRWGCAQDDDDAAALLRAHPGLAWA